jgi:hypothetical protein
VLGVPAGQVLPPMPGLTVAGGLVGLTPTDLAALPHPLPV